MTIPLGQRVRAHIWEILAKLVPDAPIDATDAQRLGRHLLLPVDLQ
jgi:hypothetical protein